MDSAVKQRRSIHRSPSYPAFSLAEAIQKAEAVYKHEKRNATTPDVIASHLGYSQANGPGGRAVSALKQFGLIEESGGKCRISDLGYTLVHFDRNSKEWLDAIMTAAEQPTLFRELLEEYQRNLPSDATLKNELLKRGFNPSAVSDVVSILRDTLSLAFGEKVEYPNEMTGVSRAGVDKTLTDQVIPASVQSMAISTPVGKDSDGRPVFAHVRFDAALQKDFVTGLKKYLEYLETTLQ